MRGVVPASATEVFKNERREGSSGIMVHIAWLGEGSRRRPRRPEIAGSWRVSINHGRPAIAHSSRLGIHRQCSERTFRRCQAL